MCSLWLELSQKSGSHQKKRSTNVEHDKRTQFPLSFDPLLYPPGCTTHVDDDPAFDDMIETFLPELLRTRALLLEQKSDYDEQVSFAFHLSYRLPLNGMSIGYLPQTSHSIRDIIFAHDWG